MYPPIRTLIKNKKRTDSNSNYEKFYIKPVSFFMLNCPINYKYLFIFYWLMRDFLIYWMTQIKYKDLKHEKMSIFYNVDFFQLQTNQKNMKILKIKSSIKLSLLCTFSVHGTTSIYIYFINEEFSYYIASGNVYFHNKIQSITICENCNFMQK